MAKRKSQFETVSAKQEQVLTGDKVVQVTTRVEVADRVVQWDDIEARVEYDDCTCETPWENCDGWEHEAQYFSRMDDLPIEAKESVRCCWNQGDRDYIWLTIEDKDIVTKWGLPSWIENGASKQVRAEWIADTKRKAYEQLADWYSNGWSWYGAVAEYGDICESVWGIDDEDYAQEVAETDMRWQVVSELEAAGYIVENQPEPSKGYDRVAMMRDRIHRQLGYRVA